MCYLAIKELANIAEDVIIVTSSLTKDMTGKEDSFRASAIRALCKITDTQMLAGIERYLKQAIVDKNPAVSSAALVSSLVRCCFDIEKLVYSMFYINQCMHKGRRTGEFGNFHFSKLNARNNSALISIFCKSLDLLLCP